MAELAAARVFRAGASCAAAMRSRAYGAALLLVACAVAPTSGARETLEDEWLIVRIAGEQAGHAHTLVIREGDLVISTTDTVVKLERLGVPLSQEVRQEFRETASGEPLGLRQRTSGGAQDVEIEGTFEGRTLRLVSRTMGVERRRSEEIPAGSLFGRALEEFIRRELRRGVGTSFSFRTYSVELDRLVEVTYEVAGEEEIEVLGRRVRATRSLVRGLYPGIVPVEYRDAEGTVWKVEMGLMGLSMEMLRANRELALGRGTGAAPAPARGAFDVLAGMSVRSPVRFHRPREVDYARYRIALKGGRADGLALEGPGQSVVRTERDGSAIVEVRKVDPDRNRTLPHPIREPALERYLAASTYVQSDDPEIAKVASEVAGQVSSSLAAARRLELWVFRNVREKGFDRGFATAKETLVGRAGDCTEHSVLLCALLRAAGIPSRVVSGVVYVELPSGEPVFAYHMWTEAYVGEWVPLDATLGGGFVDATHLRFAESDLAGMSPASGMVEMLQLFGQLEIEVLEFTVAGRHLAPDSPPEGALERRYRHAGLGVSFVVPEGWESAPPADGTAGPTERERGVVCAFRARATGERLVLAVRSLAPGSVLSEAIDALAASAQVHSRTEAALGGLPAVRIRYTKRGGETREGVAALRHGTLYVLRAEPPTDSSRAALEKAASTFAFE